MMIGGGSRGKDRGQWDGWALEESSKRPSGTRSRFLSLFTDGCLSYRIKIQKGALYFTNKKEMERDRIKNFKDLRSKSKVFLEPDDQVLEKSREL